MIFLSIIHPSVQNWKDNSICCHLFFPSFILRNSPGLHVQNQQIIFTIYSKEFFIERLQRTVDQDLYNHVTCGHILAGDYALGSCNYLLLVFWVFSRSVVHPDAHRNVRSCVHTFSRVWKALTIIDVLWQQQCGCTNLAHVYTYQRCMEGVAAIVMFLSRLWNLSYKAKRKKNFFHFSNILLRDFSLRIQKVIFFHRWKYNEWKSV